MVALSFGVLSGWNDCAPILLNPRYDALWNELSPTAMATRNVSPGGALLRASRMFSIPPPLSRPIVELTAQAVFNSDTATLPYPTHLTITTPPSSLSKGDWGLKRPLPLRSTTKTSTPLIRVNSLDTLEHVTDFVSAADHTLTLQKWQEMNLPLTTPKPKDSSIRLPGRTPTDGVFEEALDGRPLEDEKRYRFDGPWLPGQTVGEFNAYLEKDVRKRKMEFRLFLKEQKAAEDTIAAQRIAREEGLESVVDPVKASDITDDQLRDHIRELRQDRRQLFALIRKFLDLPPSPVSSSLEDSFNSMLGLEPGKGAGPRTIKSEDFLNKSRSPYAESGPPRTHPSAGLSYLRSGAYVYNHALYGPQAKPPPIEARVVMPKGAAVGSFPPKLGVAGIVTEVPQENSFNTSNVGKQYQAGHITRQSNPGLINIEPDKVGGSKVWVEPKVASIDPKGRITLTVAGASDAAVAIHRGTPNDVPESVRRPYVPPQPLPLPARTTNQGYGLESPSVGKGRGRVSRNDGWSPSQRGEPSKSAPTENEAFNALQGLLDSGFGSSPRKR